MFKIIRKSMKYSFLIILCILLILMIIFNSYTYTFPNQIEMQYKNEQCKTVYYEPYNIFKYRKMTPLSNWISKDGEFLTSVQVPGSSIYLSANDEGSYNLNSKNVMNTTSLTLSKEDYEEFKKEGVSSDVSAPTITDYFIGKPTQGKRSEVQVYEIDEMLGRIKACKE